MDKSFSCFYENQCRRDVISNKIKIQHFHHRKQFIDYLCAVNDGGEFGRTSADTYPKEIEFKLEYHGTHVFFLNPGINIMDGKFIYKLFD